MEEDLLVFRNASTHPVMEPRVAERLDTILAHHACFSAHPRGAHGQKKRHGGGGNRRGGRNHHPNQHQHHGGPGAGGGALRAVRSMSSFVSSAGTASERAIRSDLNKLAPGNYHSVARRLRFIADIDNLTFTFRTALEKAYLEPEHNRVYVNLFGDILDSLGAGERQVAIDIVQIELPTDAVVRVDALRPLTDPAKNYDAFCDAIRIKRRLVGRSSLFASLLGIGAVSRSVCATPADLYHTHERVMRELVAAPPASGAQAELDGVGAVEVMLESLGTVIRKHPALRRDFTTSIDEISLDVFPSAKCRFKIMDILGR
eukprot:jgi/Tetstr1/454238/TSEL_041157.t1